MVNPPLKYINSSEAFYKQFWLVELKEQVKCVLFIFLLYH